MTGHIYRDVILEQHVHLFRGAMGADFLFMDDHARPHRANIVDECLQSEDITRMDWPAYSPDLNPIQHVFFTSSSTQADLLTSTSPIEATVSESQPASPISNTVFSTSNSLCSSVPSPLSNQITLSRLSTSKFTALPNETLHLFLQPPSHAKLNLPLLLRI
ncbi:DDE_3 domain-containing protein [Trichonephila clavipes]|nr:DDE_3 domain-containing protein [Trichonephila clavipes]